MVQKSEKTGRTEKQEKRWKRKMQKERLRCGGESSKEAVFMTDENIQFDEL